MVLRSVFYSPSSVLLNFSECYVHILKIIILNKLLHVKCKLYNTKNGCCRISETKHLNIIYIRYSMNLLVIVVIRKNVSALGFVLVPFQLPASLFDLTFLNETETKLSVIRKNIKNKTISFKSSYCPKCYPFSSACMICFRQNSFQYSRSAKSDHK